MRTRIATLSVLFLACACASANPRPPEAPQTPAPPSGPPPAFVRPMTQPTAPPPARPVSSDPGVRTLQSPALGGLVAETEPDAPPGAAPRPTASSPRSAPVARPVPVPGDDGLGAPPAGPLPPVPDAP